jgi:DNA-binding HxlR family transcriptional regulator
MDSYVTETIPEHTPGACREALIPVTEVLAQIGGKWTVHILLGLAQREHRFSELLRSIEGISQKMLTATLRDLERDGFVTRAVTPSIPPRVDYAITEMGRELVRPLSSLARWARENRHRVEDARENFAKREQAARRLAW